MKDHNNMEINEAVLFSYFKNELTKEEMEKVEDWKNNSVHNKSLFEETKGVWEITGNIEVKPVVVDENKAWDKVLDKIEKDDKVVRLKPRNRKVIWGIAAALLVTIGITYFLTPAEINGELVELQAKNEVMLDTLSDGSQIALNANSILTYPEEFSSEERRVSLKGEAFFNVERDETKPFIIDLPNNFEVKVLGTSFNIKANENDSLTEVYVASGKVEVSSINDKILLVKNEKAFINNRTGEIKKSELNSSGNSELFWMDKSLKFNGTKFKDVIEELRVLYQQEIELDSCLNHELPIVSQHKNESLHEILEVISEIVGAKYVSKTVNGKVVHFLMCDV